MKIQNHTEEQVQILDSNTDVWSLIRDIASNTNQEEAFYVCNLSEIAEKHKIWQSQLPRVEPHYAVKCNDNITVLEVLAALGTSFDCASKAEISKVLSIGVRPDQIIFANPAKPASHIRYAASVGVSTMTFDNESELYKIHSLYSNSKLVIRIRCDAVDAQCPLGMKFGCDPIKEAPHLLRLAKSLDLNVVGVSFHVGSGCREPDVFHRAISATRDIFDYAKSLDFDFTLVDIGGGYPGVRGSSIDKIADIVNDALDQYFPDPSIRVIAEPGRFYVSSAYTLACSIHSIRSIIQEGEHGNTSKTHKMYYINDGVYGSFNCILYDHQVVKPIPLYEYPGTKKYSSSIWGPTCDGLDQVVEDVVLPQMELGDWVVFEDMGAYTLPVASPFNGFPVPQVHFVVTESVWDLIKDVLTPSEDNFKILDGPAPVDNFTVDKKPFAFSNIPSVIHLPQYNGVTVAGDRALNYIDISIIE